MYNQIAKVKRRIGLGWKTETYFRKRKDFKTSVVPMLTSEAETLFLAKASENKFRVAQREGQIGVGLKQS